MGCHSPCIGQGQGTVTEQCVSSSSGALIEGRVVEDGYPKSQCGCHSQSVVPQCHSPCIGQGKGPMTEQCVSSSGALIEGRVVEDVYPKSQCGCHSPRAVPEIHQCDCHSPFVVAQPCHSACIGKGRGTVTEQCVSSSCGALIEGRILEDGQIKKHLVTGPDTVTEQRIVAPRGALIEGRVVEYGMLAELQAARAANAAPRGA